MKQTPKITEINGCLYSREPFDGYLMRLKVCFVKHRQEHSLDIYTTQQDTDQFIVDIKTAMKPGVRFDRISYFSTREDDIRIDELLKETLDGI